MLDAKTLNGCRLLAVSARAGMVSTDQAAEAMCALAAAARKIPFPEGPELRVFLLGRWKRNYGVFRFFYPGWWRVFFYGGD